MKILKTWRKLGANEPSGFQFGRPLVLLQSDDWGRVGVRDEEGREELRAAGVNLGERPYDLYSLETAEDIGSLAETLAALQDSAGQPVCLGMNFLMANVDFPTCSSANYRQIALKPLAEGLPGRWRRPGLFEAYREGIAARVFAPALHGLTHFCQAAAGSSIVLNDERGELLRTMWKCETAYIQWRMPWIGYEYWNPEKAAAERFVPAQEQERWIGTAANLFRTFFGRGAHSACAPGYRAETNTFRAWSARGIRIAQNGPGAMRAPHFDEYGMLHTYRSLDFEPALDPKLNANDSVRKGEEWLKRHIPLVISIHSINFHSTLAPFRQRTLMLLRELLSGLKNKYTDLLYINDGQLLEIVETGGYESGSGKVEVGVRVVGKGGEA